MCDTVNTTTVVVLFRTFVYYMLIYYKTLIYQCLIMQVKSPSICSRVPEPGSDPLIGSGRETGRDMLSLDWSAAEIARPFFLLTGGSFCPVLSTSCLRT